MAISLIPIAKQRVQAILDYALNHTYIGPSLSGDMYDGWPISKLLEATGVDQLSITEQAEIIREIRTMFAHTLRPTLGGIPAGVGQRPPRTPSDLEMLAMRMRWQEGSMHPFHHLAVHSVGEKTFVWIITKDCQSVVIEDEAAMFPSDKLVTQVRMLQP